MYTSLTEQGQLQDGGPGGVSFVARLRQTDSNNHCFKVETNTCEYITSDEIISSKWRRGSTGHLWGPCAVQGSSCRRAPRSHPRYKSSTRPIRGATAYRVLQQHPQVLSSRMAIVGLSLGSSVALQLTIYSQVIKLRCAVCISGSHVQPAGGSLKQTLDYLHRNSGNSCLNEKNELICRDLVLPIPTEPKLKADVGQLRCPLLLVAGEDDQNWAVSESAVDVRLFT